MRPGWFDLYASLDGRIVRPLLGWTSQEIRSFLDQGGRIYLQGSPNAEDIYLRNRLRLEVVPLGGLL